MENTDLLKLMEKSLKEQAYPCLLSVRDTQENILSATAIWNMSLHRRHALRKAGMKSGDVWLQKNQGVDTLINFLACLHGNYVFALGMPHGSGRDGRVARLFSTQGKGEIGLQGEVDIPCVKNTERGFALLLNTSGTSTGITRSVLIDSAALSSQLLLHRDALKITEESNRLLLLPWGHSFGFVLDLLLGIFSRQYLFRMHDAFLHPRAILDIVAKYEIEWLALVPRVLELLCAFAERSHHYSEVLKQVNVHCGGAYLATDRRQEIQSQVKRLYWGYGLTECGPGVSMDGLPLACEIKLVAREASRFADLWVRSPNLGVWFGQEESLHDGWLKTGDLAIQTHTGELEILGRANDCLKASDGMWVNLRTLEAELQEECEVKAISISQAANAESFEIRTLLDLVPNQDSMRGLVHRIERKLQKIGPQTIDLRYALEGPEISSKLLAIPKKSLNEALAALSAEDFISLKSS